MTKFITDYAFGHDGETHSHELNEIGKMLFGDMWHGALGRNEVQKKYKGGVALVNMDKRQYGLPSGTHWTCLVDNHYYDPLMPNGKDWSIEQKDEQRNCGQRCVAYAMLYLMNRNLAEIV